MNNESISDELDKLIEKLKTLGTQSEQFDKTQKSLNEYIEVNKKLSENYSDTLEECNQYINRVIASFDDNVFNKVAEQIENSKKIVDDCIQKNADIEKEFEKSRLAVDKSIENFVEDYTKNNRDFITKIDVVNDNIESSKNELIKLLDDLKNGLESKDERAEEMHTELKDELMELQENNKEMNGSINSLKNEFESFKQQVANKEKKDKKTIIVLGCLVSLTIVLVIVTLIFVIIK